MSQVDAGFDFDKPSLLPVDWVKRELRTLGVVGSSLTPLVIGERHSSPEASALQQGSKLAPVSTKFERFATLVDRK